MQSSRRCRAPPHSLRHVLCTTRPAIGPTGRAQWEVDPRSPDSTKVACQDREMCHPQLIITAVSPSHCATLFECSADPVKALAAGSTRISQAFPLHTALRNLSLHQRLLPLYSPNVPAGQHLPAASVLCSASAATQCTASPPESPVKCSAQWQLSCHNTRWVAPLSLHTLSSRTMPSLLMAHTEASPQSRATASKLDPLRPSLAAPGCALKSWLPRWPSS